MSLVLYGHPFSSYTQKVLIALYENGTPFAFRNVWPESADTAEWLRRWPIAKFVEEARPFRPLFPLGAPDRD